MTRTPEGITTLDDAGGTVATFVPGINGDTHRAQRVRNLLASIDESGAFPGSISDRIAS